MVIAEYQHPQLFSLRITRNMPGDLQILFRFRNGYGASVVQNGTSYGRGDRYELAVIRYLGPGEHEWSLCYETPITGDVIGHLSISAAHKILNDIGALGPDAKALPGANLD